MPLEIRPEPEPGERAVIEQALREVDEEGEAGPSRWWEAGLAENLDGDAGGFEGPEA